MMHKNGDYPILEKTDRNILALLQANGRATNAEIGEKLGLSISACHRRIKLLEEKGIITRYSTIVDPSKLGLKAVAFIVIKLKSHGDEVLDEFEKSIALMDEVVECYAISGVGDYMLKVATTDIDAFGKIAIKRLARLPGLNDLSSNFVLSTIKLARGWPVEI